MQCLLTSLPIGKIHQRPAGKEKGAPAAHRKWPAGCWSMRPPRWRRYSFTLFFPARWECVCVCVGCVCWWFFHALCWCFFCFFFFYLFAAALFFASCVPFLRLRHSRLFISNFISYEFVCFYRAPQRSRAARANNKGPPHSSLKPWTLSTEQPFHLAPQRV